MVQSPLRFATRDGSPWEPRFVDEIILENCTRCGFCRKVCPAGVFELAEKKRVFIAFHGSCRGCGVCQNLCKARAVVCRPLSELPLKTTAGPMALRAKSSPKTHVPPLEMEKP